VIGPWAWLFIFVAQGPRSPDGFTEHIEFGFAGIKEAAQPSVPVF
jgi:hypothetical protein